MKYSVFSLILPELTFEEQVALAKDLGYDAIEIRIADVAPQHRGKPFSYWGNHRDPIGPSNINENLPRLKRVTRDNAVAVCGLAPYIDVNDPDGFEPVAVAAEQLGAGLVRVRAPRFTGVEDFTSLFEAAVAGLARIEEIARSHRVKAALETHHGTIAPSASAMRRILEGFDPAAVGAIFDPGNMLQEGYERWSLGLQILGPYLAHVHVKNTVWVLTSKPPGGPYVWEAKNTRLREGAGNWKEILGALKDVGYDGHLSIEDFTEGPTRDKLGDAIAYLKSLGA